MPSASASGHSHHYGNLTLGVGVPDFHRLHDMPASYRDFTEMYAHRLTFARWLYRQGYIVP